MKKYHYHNSQDKGQWAKAVWILKKTYIWKKKKINSPRSNYIRVRIYTCIYKTLVNQTSNKNMLQHQGYLGKW